MRKYYRATLLAVAVFSVISLLFYRHEYNKLRYVLEILNYFGKAGQKEIVNNCTKGDTKPEKDSFDFDEPFSSWQRLSDDLFVYSSYSKNNREVVTVGFGKLRNNLNLNCNVYLDEENRIVPGQFSYSIMKNTTDVIGNDEYCAFLLKCEYLEEKNPIGVTYYQMINATFTKESFFLPIKRLPTQTLNVNSYAFCIAPPENRITLSEMTNFLNTHKLLGVDDFIVYDYGIPVLFNKELKSATKYSYTNIPWNFPFSKARARIIKEIIEFDCLYRTYNKVMYTAVLSWEENIVLNYHSGLHNLMVDFKKNKMYGHRYMLKSSVYCVQNRDDKLKINATNARKQEGNWKSRSVYIFKPDDVLNNEFIRTMDVLPEFGEVKRYQVCSNVKKKVKSKVPHFRKSFKFAGDT